MVRRDQRWRLGSGSDSGQAILTKGKFPEDLGDAPSATLQGDPEGAIGLSKLHYSPWTIVTYLA